MKTSNSRSIRMNADGTIIDVPAIEGYAASDIDASEPAYYGFLRADGAWYIIKAATTATVTNYTYAVGSSGYAAAWTGRAAQSYDVYSAKF